MEILFRQAKSQETGVQTPLDVLGVSGCMVKYISYERDRSYITKKRHYHTGIEIHIIEKGKQIYEVDGRRLELCRGELLAILPGVTHTVIETERETVKYAIFFNLSADSPIGDVLGSAGAQLIKSDIRENVADSLSVIREERRKKSPYGWLIASGRVTECILTVLRPVSSNEYDGKGESEEDERLIMAKQYISDNLHRSMSVREIASYCHIGEKQLTRIFNRHEGMGAAEYIRDKRCKEIERLLVDTEMSLSEISEAMGFSNEYYFNTFFKRLSGMSPGEYRKTV